ncbi:MAG: protein-glutamate O-methyltransferase CheR [Bacteroidetes bacterium]|nr:protein-glutamate O-methyltransferase CheR [Bacteroidota bacterium]MCH8523149.1 protein-glutamate O-methyltransferase CheR [Balneolales bacterium]
MMEAIPILSPAEMNAWSAYIQKSSGIYLETTKSYLIQTRLSSLFRSTKSTSWTNLLQTVQLDKTGSLHTHVINAITTNETSFFRDQSPFELLRHKLIPELIDRRRKEGHRQIPIRIFSAACSTGQEIYSTIILLKELLIDLQSYDIQISGIDISDKAVAQASIGIFSELEVSRGLTPQRLNRFFQRVPEGYKIHDELRFLASFRKGNLLTESLAMGTFDIVFCRNVGIYFQEHDRKTLFRNMSTLLKKDGALIIGSTETLSGIPHNLELKRHLRSVYYQYKVSSGTSDTQRAPAHLNTITLTDGNLRQP